MYQIHSHHSCVGSNSSSPSFCSSSSSASSSSSSSSDFRHDSPVYSSPYESLSDPMVDEFLRDVTHMIPHSSHYSYESMDIDPSRLHDSGSSPTAIDSRQPNMHQEHLDAFIDFDAERSGRSFEAQHSASAKSQHFDSGDWSWFDNMVTAPSSYAQYNPHHPHQPGGFPDTHQHAPSHGSPGALDSGTSSYSR